jgi:hypothetical protein
MNLSTDHYARCIRTLETSLVLLEKAEPESIEQEVFRPGQPLPGLADLREAFSESSLPILVDILDWARIPPNCWRERMESKDHGTQSI